MFQKLFYQEKKTINVEQLIESQYIVFHFKILIVTYNSVDKKKVRLNNGVIPNICKK